MTCLYVKMYYIYNNSHRTYEISCKSTFKPIGVDRKIQKRIKKKSMGAQTHVSSQYLYAIALNYVTRNQSVGMKTSSYVCKKCTHTLTHSYVPHQSDFMWHTYNRIHTARHTRSTKMDIFRRKHATWCTALISLYVCVSVYKQPNIYGFSCSRAPWVRHTNVFNTLFLILTSSSVPTHQTSRVKSLRECKHNCCVVSYTFFFFIFSLVKYGTSMCITLLACNENAEK